MRIEANKKFLDDYFRRGLKKNAALKYDEIYKDYDILEALHAIKDRMGDSSIWWHTTTTVKAQIKTGGIVRKTIGRVLKRNAQVLDDIYLAITPDNRVVSMNTDRKNFISPRGSSSRDIVRLSNQSQLQQKYRKMSDTLFTPYKIRLDRTSEPHHSFGRI